jgi:hypothetical protein
MFDRQLLDSCRALRSFFCQPPEKIAEKLANPAAVAAVLPHVRELLTGVEDLGDRLSMVELSLRSIRREELHSS